MNGLSCSIMRIQIAVWIRHDHVICEDVEHCFGRFARSMSISQIAALFFVFLRFSQALHL